MRKVFVVLETDNYLKRIISLLWVLVLSISCDSSNEVEDNCDGYFDDEGILRTHESGKILGGDDSDWSSHGFFSPNAGWERAMSFAPNPVKIETAGRFLWFIPLKSYVKISILRCPTDTITVVADSIY